MSLNNSLDTGVKEARTNNDEGLSPGRCPMVEQRRPDRHKTTARKKWTEDNKFAITCYLKANEDDQRGCRKRMHQYWIQECRFEIQEQHLACQVGSMLKTKKWSKLKYTGSTGSTGRANTQGQPEERGAQEILVEQGHDNEQQQKTYHVYSSPQDDEILVKKTEMERYNEEEKELLMRVAKEIRCDPERRSPNLRYIDRKVRAATMKINKIYLS